MIRNIQLNLTQRPAWQRLLIFVAAVIITATLFWIGLIFFVTFAFIALGFAIVARLKYKITGRPLFKTPEQFYRASTQNQQQRDSIIEGEVVKQTKDDR